MTKPKQVQKKLSENTGKTFSVIMPSFTCRGWAYLRKLLYRSLSGITCIHHTPIKRHLKTNSMYTNRQESYTNTQESYTNTQANYTNTQANYRNTQANYTNAQANYTNTQCRFGKVSAVQPASRVSPASEAKLTFTCQHVQ